MRWRYHAFTLIELLVVLVIIGVITAAASLMFSSSRRSQQDLKTAVDLFRGRTVLAQQEAILSTSTLGVAISSDSYQFYRYIEVLPSHQWQWQMLKNDKVLSKHRWPKQVELALQVNNKQSRLLGNVNPTKPQVIFYPSGQITPFSLTTNSKFTVSGYIDGKILAGDTNA